MDHASVNAYTHGGCVGACACIARVVDRLYVRMKETPPVDTCVDVRCGLQMDGQHLVCDTIHPHRQTDRQAGGRTEIHRPTPTKCCVC
mmetsp:Transcript_19752/g.56709  ORF Transcript_19752/g.56709 Transcript_19752/m.56709 type:complete len:88 (-) Transcript_19752:1807-2070(-)